MISRGVTILALVAVVIATIVALTAPREALAQRAAPTLDAGASFDPPSATIGDRVTLTLRVTHPDDVILKASAPKLEHVDVVNTIPSTTTTAAGGTQVTTFAFTLQPFVLGIVDTGTLRLSWLRADGATGTFDVPGAKLIITPVRAAADQALRPLKPQVSIAGAPPSWLRPVIGAAALLLIAILVSVAAAVVRRRRTEPATEAALTDNSPERIARDALDGLGAHGGPASLNYAAYYGGLAVTVRTYLSARFGFNAYALTTRELERRMVSHGVDRWQARLVGGLLERCDDAVYAHRHPDFASADHDLTVAYEIVELSRPRAGGEGQAALA